VLQEPVVSGGAVLGDALTELGEYAGAGHGFSPIRAAGEDGPFVGCGGASS
jgi:hypothetical protein